MLILSKVYPRAYGGTEQISSLIIFRKGLSPRVRGNLDEEWEATRLTIDLLAPPAVRREATARFFADGWVLTGVKTNMATKEIEIYG